MPNRNLSSRPSGALAPWTFLLGAGVVALAFVVGGLVSYLNTRALNENVRLVTQTHDVLTSLDSVLALMKDAETGQRGYIITGEERYLEPYDLATRLVDERLAHIGSLILENPQEAPHFAPLKAAVAAKLNELSTTITIARTGDLEAARNIVSQDRGREFMEQIRDRVAAIQQIERGVRTQRMLEMSRAFQAATVSGIATSIVGICLSGIVGYLLHQASLRRARQEWLQAGQLALARTMEGDQQYDQLGSNILRFFAEYLRSPAAAFFVLEGATLRRVATYGTPSTDGVPERVELTDGLIGQAARDRRSFFVHHVPDGYLKLSSALGNGKPAHLAVVPVLHEGRPIAVMEFGFTTPPNESVVKLFEQAAESIGPAVRSIEYREGLQRLLEETQRQAEELQAQSEELRVSNEELEEQGRALRESQLRLENQQAELEEINANLEEQTQLLEMERDQVARSRTELERQAQELERANQYKSDFLANMSHELRTPLNSSLILAKLLADNPTGNLTEEQVEFAETIRTAGNDLLTLINDILDLSKIEAGHMEVRPDTFHPEELLGDLRRTFQPLADQKKLSFSAQALPGCPETLFTDRQRLEQVLKNLLSNAIKFTERGQVQLTVRASGERVSFAVSDTGIGIPERQREMVFEAFRQVDSAANRNYSGTGLGLSISRELAKLLGGEIQLDSQEGRGSTFTLTIPVIFTPKPTTDTLPPGPAPVTTPRAPSPAVKQPAKPRATRALDDRTKLTPRTRTILVVEDDSAFAKILFDLVHELEFQCLLASNAEEALAAAMNYLPDAVILDIGLPDHSGLWVLDRLKHERTTRHIPVHVISAEDHAEPAYMLGAVGYLLKPAARDQLKAALQRLESRFAQRMRRVLIVEDDPIQMESVRKLLRAEDVETVGAATAAECLERLKSSTFDCMVLDLTLPDDSGYNLLETLSREESNGFPPVIVYTGRDLSSAEEQRLRRFSRSIIIKGARSPERLLDEVTLFLHRVVSDLPPEQQRMLEQAHSRDATIEGRRILVVEDDVRNVFALSSMLEPRGAVVQIARNGREALDALEQSRQDDAKRIDLVLMDVMMPEMDGITAMREIRRRPEWKRLPVIMLTAKAMPDDQENCLAAGANDYMAKPLDVDKLLSLVRVWMPR